MAPPASFPTSFPHRPWMLAASGFACYTGNAACVACNLRAVAASLGSSRKNGWHWRDRTMSVVGHLLGGLRRAIGRVLLWFLIFGIIGAAVVEVVAFVETGHGPGLFTNITAAAMGI